MVSTRDNSAEDSGDQVRTQPALAYTAGPWKLSHSGQQIHGPRGQWIAIIKCESCPAHEAGNAALIAAAPDLLEALKLTVALLDGLPDPEHIEHGLNKARAAITKATGDKS